MSTLEERIADVAVKNIAMNPSRQRRACDRREMELGFDTNYKMGISAIVAGSIKAGVAIDPKVATAQAEWQAIWTERDARIASQDLSLDYSNVGSAPTHSYSAIQAELEGT